MKPAQTTSCFVARPAFVRAAPLVAAALAFLAPAHAQKPSSSVKAAPSAKRFAKPTAPVGAAAARDNFDNLTPGGSATHGFQVIARYTDDAGKPFGARLRHARTGFYLDLLRIPSAPQGFLWVNTPPISDRGEPHTQEHLLLGKGNAGRAAANFEGLSLTVSNAFTMQWRTCYDFHTTAGADTFFKLFASCARSLLNPDYTDEEIRREVRNFGLSETETGALRLEEQGSVYNEMVGAFGNAGSNLWQAVGEGVYGTGSALSWNSGGTPDGIRTMTPAHIRKFHGDHYRLGNMGLIASLPPAEGVRASLARFDTVLRGLQPGLSGPVVEGNNTKEGTPLPSYLRNVAGGTVVKRGLAPGAIRRVPYPEKNREKPSDVVFAFPAVREGKADLYDRLLFGLFWENIAGEADTPLYKKLVDGKTRVADTGATGVSAWFPDDPGRPVYVYLSNVKPARAATDADLAALRKIITGEIARIAALPDGSPALADFNRRALARLTETRRGLRKFTDSPPGFGDRGNGSGWMDHLNALAEYGGGATRSVTLKPQIARAQTELASAKINQWRPYLNRWKLTGPTAPAPLTFVAVPDPVLAARLEAERDARIKAEVARLQTVYAVTDDQEAIKRYKTDYDKATALIDATSAEGQARNKARFVASPPLTLDDTLSFSQTPLAVRGGANIPFTASRFDGMSGGSVGLAVSLRPVAERDRFLVSALPFLLTDVGFIENNKPVSYETARERQKREILSLTASTSTNDRTLPASRIELTLTGAGGDRAETRRALRWMRLALASPDWRPENLGRLRDVVDQNLADLRSTQQGAEENWARGVGDAVRGERDPLSLSANSFLTQTHNLLRLRWLFKGRAAPDPKNLAQPDVAHAATLAYLAHLATAPQATTALAAPTRADLTTLLATLRAGGAASRPPGGVAGVLQPLVTDFDALPEPARAVIRDAADDLEQTLGDLPDASLAADWSYLCRDVFARGLETPPRETLARLGKLRQDLLNRNTARVWAVGSGANLASLRPDIANLCADALPGTFQPAAIQPAAPLVTARVLARGETEPGGAPVYYGLVNPSGQGGVFVHSAKGTAYEDAASRPAVLRFLASEMLSGGGAHTLFMKTWGAGLAYGNGVHANPRNGRITYYADRTPELSQTLRFAIGQIKLVPQTDNANLTEYAVAQAFDSREANSYEERARAVAADLADGVSPARVRAFRQALLRVRNEPNLYAELRPLLEPVWASVLPGLAPNPGANPTLPSNETSNVAEQDRTVLVVIAPPKQLDLYEAYLRRDVSLSTRLVRLYPRDFWLTD